MELASGPPDARAAVADSWIEAYLHHHRLTEPPEDYTRWTAISVVASALGKKVWMRLGSWRIYPNFYIVLFGPSGGGKTTAMKYGKAFLQGIGTTIAPDAISGWEAFTHYLVNRCEEEKEIRGIGRVLTHELTAHSEELGVFLRDDLFFMQMLTSLYDSDDGWEYYTIKRESDLVSWAFFNWIAGVAPSWVRVMLPTAAIDGGWAQRVVWVVGSGKERPDADDVLDPREHQGLADRLTKLSRLNGEVVKSPEFVVEYRAWRRKLWEDARAGHPPIRDPRFEGYNSRYPLLALKLCIIHAAAEREELMLRPQDLAWALATMHRTEARMPEVFAGHGASTTADAQWKLIQALRLMGEASTREILQTLAYDMDLPMLEVVTKTLERQGTIAIRAKGGEMYYRLTEGR